MTPRLLVVLAVVLVGVEGLDYTRKSNEANFSLSASKDYLNHNLAWADTPKTSSEYADPCKAAAYLGDIALTEEDLKLFQLSRNPISRIHSSYSTTSPFTSIPSALYTPFSPTYSLKRNHRMKKKLRKKYIYSLPRETEKRKTVEGKKKQKRGSKRRGKKQKKAKHHRKSKKVLRMRSVENAERIRKKSRSKRAATARKERLWEHGIIPYEIEGNFSGNNKVLFVQAMKHWENHTCITFVRKTPSHHNYILFTEKPCGCCSFVGRRGNGVQAISIGKNCDKFGIVVHELGHVIGFWHEHTRPDRDSHVQIIFKHIMPGQEYNFNTLTNNEVNSLEEPYDFNSIMHYARNTFSRSSHLDTILPLEKHLSSLNDKEIGQRVQLSEGDIKQANKLYRCPKCGRTLQETSGHFSFWWNQYPIRSGRTVCQWRISGTHGERILLNLTRVNIPGNSECSNDYLEVRDGYWVNAPLLGKFCNFKPHSPHIMFSTDNRMWVQYERSKIADMSSGFSAVYNAICGGKIVKESGILTSPFYPEFYKNDKTCTWSIMVPDGYTVALKFHSFDIEHHNDCVYDYVEVKDGPNDMSPLIGRFCGTKLPPEIKSSTNWMHVLFFSDNTVGKNGFAATFVKEIDECLSDNHGCQQICNNTLGGYHCSCYIGYQLHSDGKLCEENCGGRLHFSNGSIQSPSYPNNYPPNKYCEWEIVANEGFQISLRFEVFTLEGNNHDCDYDSVVVKSESENESKVHGTYCGTTLPPLITSISNKMRVNFKTDQNTERKGFFARFVTDQDECAINNGNCQETCLNTIGSYECSCSSGFVLHENKLNCKESECKHEIVSQESEMTSLNYPDFYPSTKTCTWLFASTPGHRIRITFIEFEIENHNQCTYDYVDLHDGPNASFPLIKRLCGSRKEQPIIASSNVMFILFHSDSSSTFKGFYARQDTVCGGLLIAMPKVSHFFSHAKYGDNDYDNSENCEWKLTSVDNMHRVRVRFTAFHLEEETDCSYDSVEIYDVNNFNKEHLKGKYCRDREIPSAIISKNPSMVVKFKSDDSMTAKGFCISFNLSNKRPSKFRKRMLNRKRKLRKRQNHNWQRNH